MSSTANMMRCKPCVFAATFGSALIAVGFWNLLNSSLLWPSGVRIIAMLLSDAIEPYEAVRPVALDDRLAFELQTKFDEERDSRFRSSTTMPTLSIRRRFLTIAYCNQSCTEMLVVARQLAVPTLELHYATWTC
jgi:hypothetical protein